MKKIDVFVCGGGPAGLAAAIAARREGFDVLVADCFRPPIDKACGEGMMPDSIEALAALGVILPQERSGFFCGIRFVEAGRSVEANFPSGEGRGVRRTVLHDLLHKKALDLGVNFSWATQVLGVHDGRVRTSRDEIQAKWVIGADGTHSRIREWSNLNRGRRLSRRIGLRQHFKVRPWGEYMEIHWCDSGQAYVTPVGLEEICVVVVARKRFNSVDALLSCFPELSLRLKDASLLSSERGALTEGHCYDRVTTRHTALIGDASGSVDAITGQGLALSFVQARALGEALRDENLELYEVFHHKTRRMPLFMSQTMLLLDRFGPLRRGAQMAFGRNPRLFESLLAMHVGAAPLTMWGEHGILNMGLQMLQQQSL
jgi:flavin-dependent dehydrogenase